MEKTSPLAWLLAGLLTVALAVGGILLFKTDSNDEGDDKPTTAQVEKAESDAELYCTMVPELANVSIYSDEFARCVEKETEVRLGELQH